MVASHALLKSFTRVILPVHEWLSSHVILALNLGWVELKMVGTSRCLMDSAALDSLDENFFVNLELKNAIDVHFFAFEHGIKLLSLSLSSGEAVKEDAALALWVAEVVLDEADDELIGHELSSLHDAISLHAELSACLDSVSEHVTCGQVAHAEVILDLGSLSALARAWWSNHDDVHGGALGALIPALNLSEEVIEAHVAKIHVDACLARLSRGSLSFSFKFKDIKLLACSHCLSAASQISWGFGVVGVVGGVVVVVGVVGVVVVVVVVGCCWC